MKSYFNHELSEMLIELTGDHKRIDFTINRIKRLQRRLEIMKP